MIVWYVLLKKPVWSKQAAVKTTKVTQTDQKRKNENTIARILDLEFAIQLG